MDPKTVLQATGQLPITASANQLAYYGILWTQEDTAFSITTEDWFGQVNTWSIDKFSPAISVKKVTTHASGKVLFLLHNGNKSSLPG